MAVRIQSENGHLFGGANDRQNQMRRVWGRIHSWKTVGALLRVFMSARISSTQVSRHSRVVETGASDGTEGDGCVTEHPYENEASQKLRREMLRNDRSTLLDHARAHADDAAGGRFK